ncbi:MAG TPA: metal-dependent transcriptional regulator [Actinomycetota bacterium]|nr:metal-dependent transcriptional regulator [Actinomycetota bacterium]
MAAQVPQGAQEYLECIFEMEEEGATILQARLSERLGVTPATVSQAVKRLTAEGLIEIQDRKIRLTPLGIEVATPLVRRHRLAERLLTDILGIPWYRAHEEAHDWEHVISPEVEQRILEKTGATTCPHGNPIPGMTPPYERSKLIPLTELEVGEWGTLSLLTEDVELVTGILQYFQEHNLMPGATVKVAAVSPDGTLTLSVDGKSASLGPSLADNLWITPHS